MESALTPLPYTITRIPSRVTLWGTLSTSKKGLVYYWLLMFGLQSACRNQNFGAVNSTHVLSNFLSLSQREIQEAYLEDD